MRTAVQITAALLLTATAVIAAAASTPKRDTRMTPRAAADTTEGTWTLTRNEDGRMQLNLQFGTSSWGRPLERAELRGLTDEQIAATASTPVAFRIEREAGVFEMEGAFREGRGAGHFRFQPNRQFASALRDAGVRGTDRITDRELMVLALGDATSAEVREFIAMGMQLEVQEVIELTLHRVTPEYARQMRSLGISGTNTARDLVQLRIHRVTVDYVREMEEMGYRGLSRDELLQMGIHGVSAEQVREMRALGFTELTPRQLVELRIHRVTPEYVRSLRDAGFTDLPADALVQLRVHRVTPEFVRELAAAGYPDLTRQQIMQMGIHRVTPEFIREVRAAGYADVSPETLVQLKIHGIGSPHVRAGRGRSRA